MSKIPGKSKTPPPPSLSRTVWSSHLFLAPNSISPTTTNCHHRQTHHSHHPSQSHKPQTHALPSMSIPHRHLRRLQPTSQSDPLHTGFGPSSPLSSWLRSTLLGWSLHTIILIYIDHPISCPYDGQCCQTRSAKKDKHLLVVFDS